MISSKTLAFPIPVFLISTISFISLANVPLSFLSEQTPFSLRSYCHAL